MTQPIKLLVHPWSKNWLQEKATQTNEATRLMRIYVCRAGMEPASLKSWVHSLV